MSQEKQGTQGRQGEAASGQGDGFVLQTARLGLRPHRLGDIPFMMALNADPEVVRYTGNVAFANEEEAAEIIRALGRQYEETRTGRFLVVERASGESVGWCGLKRGEDGAFDLGYRFFRQHWGRGLATESARACAEYGFGPLGLARLVAYAAIENPASIAVLTKLGFRAIGEEFVHGMQARHFELLAVEYRAAAG